MKHEKIVVANLKCEGCATTIEKELMSINGVDSVHVDLEHDTVDVSVRYLDRWVITDRLHSLGYPEATEKNGLLLQLKSFASCMVGRLGAAHRDGRQSLG